jgi:myo-inositol-1(or 4)-monophosphatase
MLTQHTPIDFLERATTEELRAALVAAHEAGEILAQAFLASPTARSKLDEAAYNLVTDADLAAEQAITQFLKQRFPQHEILGEEEARGSVNAEHLWIVDPLDGTNNFAHRLPHFAVSIAYYHQGQAQAGVVYNPARGDCYWAELGRGAFYNGRSLQVSQATGLDQVMVGVGFYYDRGAMMEATLTAIHAFFKSQIHGIRRFGTAALDLCQVADGAFGAFFEYQLSPWDFAAGRLILEEAGGTITDGRGGQLPLAKTSVLASNSKLHAAALEIVSRHHL